MDVNIGIKGLLSLPTFLDMVSWAETDNHITSALAYKARHADKVCREIVKHGLREYMFTWKEAIFLRPYHFLPKDEYAKHV